MPDMKNPMNMMTIPGQSRTFATLQSRSVSALAASPQRDWLETEWEAQPPSYTDFSYNKLIHVNIWDLILYLDEVRNAAQKDSYSGHHQS